VRIARGRIVSSSASPIASWFLLRVGDVVASLDVPSPVVDTADGADDDDEARQHNVCQSLLSAQAR
jgi:hypothetical protein